MNWYDHHIGDYDEATSHLSAREDGIYCRLIRKYYAKEKPLPADVAKLQRWARCRDDEDRQAVVDILEEFFDLRADGYHQKTCDEGLSAYWAGAPEREVKKANEGNRVKRHREERSRLFQALVSAGQHAPWNLGMPELRALVAAIPAGNRQPATGTGREPATNGNVTATAPATPATATHTPTTNHQPPSLFSDGVAGTTPTAPKTRKKRAEKPKEDGPTTATWNSYSAAYERKYGVLPLRNSSVSGQLAQFITRVPLEEAPLIAAFFLTHKGGLYVSAKHPVNLLLRDAEKLRTDWATNQRTDPQRVSGETDHHRQQRELHAELSGGRVAARTPSAPARADLKPVKEVLDVIPTDLLR